MPTAATAGVLSLANFGPLTTTFTAPSSCATAPGYTFTGLAIGGSLMQPVDNCDDSIEFPTDCRPNGDELKNLLDSLNETELSTVREYYSPGLYCPHAWETVGVYAPDQHLKNSTVTSTADPGIFSPTAFVNGWADETSTFPPGDFWANMFTSALAPTETAVICCPSGFKADPYAGCVSKFPLSKLASKTGCILEATDAPYIADISYNTTWEFWGKTTTATAYSIANPRESTSGYWSTATVTFDESGWPNTSVGFLEAQPTGDDAEDVHGIAVVGAIYLVHSDSDKKGGNGQDSKDDDSSKDEGKDDDEQVKEGAGGRLSLVDGILVAYGFSVAAGLGLLVAW